ncbi:MAG: hypothetical protein AB7O39_03290 [Flavobacteriaceae bacterium]
MRILAVICSVWTLAIIGLALIIYAAWVDMAAAHEAAAGWQYDNSCCSSADCAEAEDGAVSATSQGWRINENGEIVAYGSDRVKPSRDSKFHVCRPPLSSKVRCIYVPGMGS